MNNSGADQTDELQEKVVKALSFGSPLRIVGGNTKSFYGREALGTPLYVGQHNGIVNYYPSELIVTARSGTLLSELSQELAGNGQILAFEPPAFGELATLGGTIACGFSGPRRPFSGSARDYVLGCKIINGNGEILSFGGEVIKNVAGYDVSRLMVGALGTLGLLLEISLKVMPMPEAEITCCIELPRVDAQKKMAALMSRSLPLSGLSFDGRLLFVRFSGNEKAIAAAAKHIGGDEQIVDNSYWSVLNEHRLPFFQGSRNLWRLCLAPAAETLPLEGEWYYDWGGGLRWLLSAEPVDKVFSVTEKAAGHAQLFRGGNRDGDVFQPLTGRLQQLNAKVKSAFDPAGLFNPYRFYRDW